MAAVAEPSLRIKFCGPIYEASGYSELSRACVRALNCAGVPLQVEAARFDNCRPTLGATGELLRQLEANRIDYNVKIINLTPPLCLEFRESACANIAYTMFEADRLPHEWVEACNQLDGVIVPSSWCREVFETSGVQVPLRVAPPGIDLDRFAAEGIKARSGHHVLMVGKETGFHPRLRFGLGPFKFYSIFQWSERKNPRGLLEAYFSEFRREEEVCLVLKTFGRDFSAAQGKWVRQQVDAVRRSMCLPDYPRVLLITEMLTQEDICRLHAACDCFVLPHRAEGLGLPLLEAMAAGNPVIATGYSGNSDFTRDDNSLLLPWQLTPCFNMNWCNWYRGDMLWAEPDLAALMMRMREVYEDRALARRIGARGRDFVRSEYHWSRRLDALLSAVGEIAGLTVARRGTSLPVSEVAKSLPRLRFGFREIQPISTASGITARPATAETAAPALQQGRNGQCTLNYCGPVFDLSGYGEFARGFVKALDRSGVHLRLEVASYDKGRPDLGADRELFERLRRREPGGRVKIINANPDCFKGRREAGCVNIGFTMFETTRIPPRWVAACNAMDGILVPSSWNRTVFKESGVTVPVRVAAPGIDLSCEEPLPTTNTWCPADGPSIRFCRLLEHPPERKKTIWPRIFRRLWVHGARPSRWEPALLSEHAGAFRFYSIFQWSERKNARGLLRAYFAEFRKADNVCLILKTCGRDTTAAEQARVAEEIVAVRQSMQLPDHAPVLLIGDMLSREQIDWLHRAGDCFVLPHRAEGFGMPHVEAMAHGRPVIATSFSGNLEFMDADNSILLPYQLRPVAGMGWSDAYDGGMMWADPDLAALRRAMRNVFADRQFAAALGRRAREHVRSNFRWSDRVDRFSSAVHEIIAIAEQSSGKSSSCASAST